MDVAIAAKVDIVYFGQRESRLSKVSDAAISVGYCRHTGDHLAVCHQRHRGSMNLANGVGCRKGYRLTLWRYMAS